MIKTEEEKRWLETHRYELAALHYTSQLLHSWGQFGYKCKKCDEIRPSFAFREDGKHPLICRSCNYFPLPTKGELFLQIKDLLNFKIQAIRDEVNVVDKMREGITDDPT